VAVNDEVECDGDAVAFEPLEDAQFLRVRFSARDFLGDFFSSALEAELKMIEAAATRASSAIRRAAFRT